MILAHIPPYSTCDLAEWWYGWWVAQWSFSSGNITTLSPDAPESLPIPWLDRSLRHEQEQSQFLGLLRRTRYSPGCLYSQCSTCTDSPNNFTRGQIQIPKFSAIHTKLMVLSLGLAWRWSCGHWRRHTSCNHLRPTLARMPSLRGGGPESRSLRRAAYWFMCWLFFAILLQSQRLWDLILI